MQIQTLLVTLLGLCAAVEAAARDGHASPFTSILQRRQQRRRQSTGDDVARIRFSDLGDAGDGGNVAVRSSIGSRGSGGGPTLTSDLIQAASSDDGNHPGADGQAPSATDSSNFINFCHGKTLTNGQQNTKGSCNGIPMGMIPSVSQMVSSIFVKPFNGERILAGQDFTIQIQMLNFAPGTFTNASSTYYSAPQDLDGQGNVIGHTHVVVQDMGKLLNPTKPLDPTKFAFFKGINDAGNGSGLLSAKVTGGLPAGHYRVCSMSSAANHQPVLMPVAQRGAQDDCVRFTAVNGGGRQTSQ